MNESIKLAAQAAAAAIGARKWARHNTSDAPDGFLQRCMDAASVVVLDRWVSGEKMGAEFEEYEPSIHDGMCTYRVFGDGRVRGLLKGARA